MAIRQLLLNIFVVGSILLHLFSCYYSLSIYFSGIGFRYDLSFFQYVKIMTGIFVLELNDIIKITYAI